MWTLLIIVLAPLLDDDLGLPKRAKDLAVEQFIAKPRAFGTVGGGVATATARTASFQGLSWMPTSIIGSVVGLATAEVKSRQSKETLTPGQKLGAAAGGAVAGAMSDLAGKVVAGAVGRRAAEEIAKRSGTQTAAVALGSVELLGELGSQAAGGAVEGLFEGLGENADGRRKSGRQGLGEVETTNPDPNTSKSKGADGASDDDFSDFGRGAFGY